MDFICSNTIEDVRTPSSYLSLGERCLHCQELSLRDIAAVTYPYSSWERAQNERHNGLTSEIVIYRAAEGLHPQGHVHGGAVH